MKKHDEEEKNVISKLFAKKIRYYDERKGTEKGKKKMKGKTAI